MLGMTGEQTSFVLTIGIIAVGLLINYISSHIRDVMVAKHTGITPWDDRASRIAKHTGKAPETTEERRDA